MAIDRLRPEWRGVARRGREAGLGGGVLVDAADRTDRLVRRVVRWRLVGGVTAAVLLVLAAGALAGASLLERAAPPARPDAADVVQPAPSETSPLGQAGRIAALEAARRLAASRMAESAPRVPRPGAVEEVAMDPASTARPSAAAPAPEPADLAECGLGSAEIGCR